MSFLTLLGALLVAKTIELTFLYAYRYYQLKRLSAKYEQIYADSLQQFMDQYSSEEDFDDIKSTKKVQH
jgi:hypothetical protein